MAWNKLSSYQTTISERNGNTCVTYHSTVIVEWDRENIILRTGGWKSVTTKRKMNQASLQFNLGFGVYQRKGDWFVRLPGQSWDDKHPAFDGDTFQIPRQVS